jgi:hypothetical protein
MGNLGRLPVRASNGGTGGRYILNGLKMAYAYDDKLDYPNAALASAGLYFRDMLGSTRCLVSGMNPPGYMVWGLQSTTPPISYASNGIYLGGQYAAQLSSSDANCSGVLPLSGDAAFTVQMVLKMDDVSPSSGAVLFDLFDPSLSGTSRAHADFYAALNAGWEGGSHLDIGEYNGSQYLQASPSWANGQYVLITVVKRPGVLNATNASVYVGTTNYALAVLGTPANGLGMNLSSNLKLRMGCWGFGNPTYCNPGQSGETQNAAVHSFFALYNRALSSDEVAHNYAALKAAMARSPRAIALQ